MDEKRTTLWVEPFTGLPPAAGADINAGWNSVASPLGDLVMTAVPQPGTLALARLGVAAMLIFRRRN